MVKLTTIEQRIRVKAEAEQNEVEVQALREIRAAARRVLEHTGGEFTKDKDILRVAEGLLGEIPRDDEQAKLVWSQMREGAVQRRQHRLRTEVLSTVEEIQDFLDRVEV